MTRQLHAAVPTSETPRCRLQRQNVQMRDLCHPLNFCGRKTCKFEKIETGVSFAAQFYPDDGAVYVYFGVVDSAGRKLRSKFTDLHNREVAAVESDISEKLEWNDSYVLATLEAKIEDKPDWPRQHTWIRATAQKFSKVFKARLGLE